MRRLSRDRMEMACKLADEAKNRTDLVLEIGGHNKRGSILYDPQDYMRSKAAELFVIDARSRNSMEDMRLVLEAMKRGERAAKPLRYGKTCLDRCYICGRQMGLTFDGRVFGAETVCPYPNGLPEYSMRLAVPSGKIVAGNNFRDEYEQDAPDRKCNGMSFGKDLASFKYNINTDMGQRHVFMFYAKRGLAHGFVGNTCPSIYRTKSGILTVSKCRYDKRYKERDVPGERVGGICTDLWWYSIADHDDFVSHGGDTKRFVDIIDVEPGIYRVTHRTHTFDRDENKTDHFAVIQRIGKIR